MELLRDISIIFGLAIVVIIFGTRLRIPPLVGFLVTGALAGPHCLGAVRASEQVEVFAEIGVVLLLFTIGLEFSIKSLLRIKKVVFIGGAAQVFATLAAGFVISRMVGADIGRSIFIGSLVALSSTAIVLRLLQEKRDADSPHGRAILGILVFQDIIVIPMILLTPLLEGETGQLLRPFLLLALKGAIVIGLLYLASRWLVPRLLEIVARTRNQELFLLSVLLILLLCELASAALGISLALGAFIAGLMIAESDYKLHALGNMLPFRNAFIGFFFVSIGMLLDVGFLFDHLPLVILLTFCVLIAKAIIAGLVALTLGFPLRSSIMVGFALSQVGEFSFILSKTGLDHDLLSGNIYQWFLSIAILTMATTPVMFFLAPRFAAALEALSMDQLLRSKVRPMETGSKKHYKDHLIVIGFGVNGRNLARTARAARVPYIIIEMNPDTVAREKENGEPIFYGDASQDAILEHADIENARVMVIAISDAAATRRIVGVARRMNPGLYIIARTRFLEEVSHLSALGADEVIPEEFETSIEIFTRVLAKYLIPVSDIERLVNDVRADSYAMLRKPTQPSASFADVVTHLSDVHIATVEVSPQSQVVEKSLLELDLRRRFGITVVAVQRQKQTLPVPGPELAFQPGDTAILLGARDDIAKARTAFSC